MTTTSATEARDTLTLASLVKSTTLMTDTMAPAEAKEPLKRQASLIPNTKSRVKLIPSQWSKTTLRKSKRFNQSKKSSSVLTPERNIPEKNTPKTSKEKTIETEARAEENTRMTEEATTRTEKKEEDPDVMMRAKSLWKRRNLQV